MSIRSTVFALLVVSAPALHAPTAAAQARAFPFPQPLPCAGPNVVPAGDRSALDAVLERCVRECRDEGDRYLARIDYAGALARFGDPAAAEAQYREAIAMRPDRPPEAIEAYNNYALLLDRQGRHAEAFDVLSRFSIEELRLYSFPATLKLWVMRQLGMDATQEAAQFFPFAGPRSGVQGGSFLPFPPMPATPNERPIEPDAFVRGSTMPVGTLPRAPRLEAPPDVPNDL